MVTSNQATIKKIDAEIISRSGRTGLVKIQDPQTRKVWTRVDSSLDRTQSNIIKSLSLISDRKDLKWTNSSCTDIKYYLIFHISSCHSWKPWKAQGNEAEGCPQRVCWVAQHGKGQAASSKQPYMRSALVSLGNPSSSEDTQTVGMTFCIRHAMRRIQGKQQLLEGGESTGSTSWLRAAARSLQTSWKLWRWYLMFSAEPWGLSHPVPRDFPCCLAA